ncbi:MAG TPA: diguanylate cyclase [Solirubrobacterales bacterium]|nr:diguanylate cyclase [Solirubrobacterales bacterium]
MLAAVEGQHHVLGLRMIADVLEGAGYEVLYLGADVPVESLRSHVAKHSPAVIGLAFGIASDVSCLADSLIAIHEAAPEAHVMLGGRAVPPGLRSAGYPFVFSSLEVTEAVEGLLDAPQQPLPSVVELLRTYPEDEPWLRDEDETEPVAERLAEMGEDAMQIARRYVRRAEIYRDLALRDPVTDLPNRRALEDELIAHTDRAAADGMVLMIDVDSFKQVNDTHGHLEGDRLLRTVGEIILNSVRPGDFAARVGGDEFAALLPGATAAEAAEVGERIRTAIHAGATPMVTVSVGVAPLTADARRALLVAETALYKAKTAGRNRVIATDTA